MAQQKTNNSAKEIAQILEEAKRVALFTHISPDADGIGSATCLSFILEEFGIENDIFIDSKIPERMLFIKGSEKINQVVFDPKQYDLMVCLDCAEPKRLGKYIDQFQLSPKSVNIDHHISNGYFGAFNYVKGGYKSCGEVLYEIIIAMGIDFNLNAAECLYTAIASDTGRFLLEGITAATFHKAAHLVDCGADLGYVHKHLFQIKTPQQINLNRVMLDNYEVIGEIGFTHVTKEEFDEVGTEMSDVDMFYHTFTDVEGTKATIIMREQAKNFYKVSFRSSGDCNVNRAASIVGGGGHQGAAGAIIVGSFDEVKKMVLDAVQKQIIYEREKREKILQSIANISGLRIKK